MSAQIRGWVLGRIPDGPLAPDHAQLATLNLPSLGPGDVRVRNLAMSLEPYLQGRMRGSVSYAAPMQVGDPLFGPAVGEVVESRSSTLPVGARVVTDAGWREEWVLPAGECGLIPQGVKSAHALGILGLSGMTAWVGLRKIARVQPGETVFISSAAGAVGLAAVQFALASGCTVIASAGSAEKLQLLRSLGAIAFNYREGSPSDLLRAALAETGASGIDVYFDNVGGEQLEAAIRFTNEGARIALCGMTSVYDAAQPGPSNLLKLVWNRVRMEGFLLRDHHSSRPEFLVEAEQLVQEGKLRSFDTLVKGGIGVAWEAYLQLSSGVFVGKPIVDLAPPML